MNKNDFLKMNSVALYDRLISYVMESPAEAEVLLEELKDTMRYKADYEFRAYVGTSEAVLCGVIGDVEKVILICMNLIDLTKALEMWQLLSTNWNLLGTAYSSLDFFEKSLDSYYRAIKVEEEHGLFAISSVAYSNIAQLYSRLGAYQENYDYLKLAIEKLKSGGENQPRYRSKYVAYHSNLVLALCKLNREEETEPIIEELQKVDIDEINVTSKYNYFIALMYHAFSRQEYIRARDIYFRMKDMILSDNKGRLFSAVCTFLELCLEYKPEYSFYIDELLMLIELDVLGVNTENLLVYRALREYYKARNECSELEEITDKYISFLEKNDKNIKNQRLHSMKVMKNLIDKKEDIADIENRNAELKLIAREAVSNKDALQEAYQRIAMINELGKKLTSSLNLDEVVELIYSNLKATISLDAFVLMVAEKEKNRLRSLAYYEDEEVQESFCIHFDNKNSIFVDCYHSAGILSSSDTSCDAYFKRHMQEQASAGADMNSAIFMPLTVESDVIGVCSIQDRKERAYSSREIKFLKQLLPYLSIALNNAVYSWKLENEIQSHLDTRMKLEAANSRLEKISSLDGLTQISSRRDFDHKIVEMLEESQNKGKEISVFMLDIDNFKLYNDNYGHLEGDEALKKVAQVFRRNMDAVNGLSARFGGEEFIGACLGMNIQESGRLAEKIREDIFYLGIPHKVTALEILTVSVGVAVSPKLGPEKKSDIMRLADEALYKAKTSGKNRVKLSIL